MGTLAVTEELHAKQQEAARKEAERAARKAPQDAAADAKGAGEPASKKGSAARDTTCEPVKTVSPVATRTSALGTNPPDDVVSVPQPIRPPTSLPPETNGLGAVAAHHGAARDASGRDRED